MVADWVRSSASEAPWTLPVSTAETKAASSREDSGSDIGHIPSWNSGSTPGRRLVGIPFRNTTRLIGLVLGPECSICGHEHRRASPSPSLAGRSFLREVEHPSHVFRHIGPNWFAAVMGTGILATAAALLPFDWPAREGARDAPLGLSVVLLLVIGAATAVHWVRHPAESRAHLADPAMAPFFGCVPMALLTVGSATLLVGAQAIGIHAAVIVDSILWGLGTALGLFVVVTVPTLMIRRGDLDPSHVFGTWLLAVVPPVVAASAGAPLISHLHARSCSRRCCSAATRWSGSACSSRP